MNHLRYELTGCLRLSTLAAVGLLVSGADIRPAAAAGAPLKVSCVGEQTTHSDLFPSRTNQPVGMQEYPAMLQTILGAGYTVSNFGDCCASVISGYTSSETHPYISGNQFQGSTGGDIIIIGSWGRHDWGMSAKTALPAFMAGDTATMFTKFQADYDTLVSKYIALANKPKIFCSTPVPIPFGADGPDDGYKTSPASDAIKAVCGKYNLPIIDLFTIFTGHKEYYINPPLKDSDGEHSSPQGALVIAQAVANAITGVDGGILVGTTGGGADAGAASGGSGSGSGSGGSSSGSATASGSSSGSAGTTTSSSSSSGGSSSGSVGTASGGGTGTGTGTGIDTGTATGSSGAGVSGSSSGSGIVMGGSTDTSTDTGLAPEKTGSVGCSAASAAETGAPWGAAVTGVLGWALLSLRRNHRRAKKDNA